jgi:5-formyltetrahydrofolate cyclo-ligase
MTSIERQKQPLRRKLLAQRQARSEDWWQSSSDRICDRLANCDEFIHANTIVAYKSNRQEPNLDRLFTHPTKQWGLPRCVGKDLHWHHWKPAQPLVMGNYGILEPDPALPQLLAENIDLLLVPAVAIDRGGYRLGYGGGYYDRLRADPCWRKIPTIGIVFDFAYVDSLPTDPWDLPLDAVCTELGLTRVHYYISLSW